MPSHPLPSLSRQFVAHFGEMGSKWGINRTVGQIYALIFISQRALNADEIADMLEFSRSNVSMGLKELQAWRLVQLRHQPGDRREYFEAPADVWEIFRVLAEERRRREIEPTLSMLRMALLEEPKSDAERHAQHRMREMHDLIDRLMKWFDDVQRLAPETAMQLMGMGATVTKVLTLKDRITGAKGKKAGWARGERCALCRPTSPALGLRCGLAGDQRPAQAHHPPPWTRAVLLPLLRRGRG